MSKIFDMLLLHAKMLLGDGMDSQLQAEMERYLKQNQLFEIEDEIDAEFELLMFKQMSPSVFRSFFMRYGQREEVELIAGQAKAAAIQRALDGKTFPQDRYQPLVDALLKAGTKLSEDEDNKRWLKPQLDTVLMNLKYAAGLSDEVSEEVARALCTE